MSGSGAWAFGSRPTFNGNAAWDAGNFNPANYLPLSGGTMTGGLTLQRTAADYNAIVLNNTSGVQLQMDANANIEGNIRTTTNHPLTFMTNNTLRLTLAAAGGATFTGSVSAVDFTATSDVRRKSDVHVLKRGLLELQKMRPREYIMDGKRRIGFLAQEAQQVIPEAVEEGDDGFLSMSHGQTLALVASAVLELADAMKAR